MKNYIVETKKLSKRFHRQYAVHEIDMQIPKGAIYGLIGKNGAGKTTTMKMLCGLMKPSDGEMHLFQDAHKEYAYRRIGALIEHVGAYSDISAKENMQLKATGLGIHDKNQVEELLHLLQLDTVGKKPVKQFSLGMKQRLGIAMALLGNPDFLILDEPINGLDPQGIRDIRDILLQLHELKGITMMISSHNLNELAKIATHYGILKDGELIEQISQQELNQKCQDHLTLLVDDVAKTITLLEQELRIHEFSVSEQNHLHIFGEVDSALLNAALLHHGIAIQQMYRQQQDLESYFLQKIGGEQHA